MAFIAAAAITGGLALAGGVGGAVIQGNAAGNAANTQADAANRATDLQREIWQQQQQNEKPWMQAGTQALSQMTDPSFQHNFSASDFQADPGYQFRMQQGQDALERSAAARGGLGSGGTLKALTEYGQNFASNEYQNAYNRFTNDQTNRFNRLSTVAGYGQNANGQMAQAGQNYANQAGQNITGAGNARGAAQIAGGNAWGNTLSGLGQGLGNTVMGTAVLRNQPNWLSGLQPGGGSAPPAVPSGPTLGNYSGGNFFGGPNPYST